MFKGSQIALAAARVYARASVFPSIRTAVAVTPKRAIQRTPLRTSAFNYSPLRFYSPNRVLDLPAKEVSYQEVKDLASNPRPDVVIVDVREPEEYEAAHIPTAINIPYKSMPGALGLDSAEFESQFGFPKPDPSKTLLFYCRSGARSTGSEQLAHTFGYDNRMNYKGSYLDWSANENGEAPPQKEESAKL